jgi:hypothetical protein
MQAEGAQRAIGVAGTAGGLLPSGCGAPAWDAPRPVPLTRWDADARAGAAGGARFGAFLPAADLFDAAASGISRQAPAAGRQLSSWGAGACSCEAAVKLGLRVMMCR